MAISVGARLGHYRVDALIGEGGVGQVYRGTDTRLERTVALKVLPEEFSRDPERLQRFVREAKATSAITHPHVAHIYEVGEADGTHYIAMEFVEGQTLAGKMRGQPLALEELRSLSGRPCRSSPAPSSAPGRGYCCGSIGVAGRPVAA